MVKLKMSMLPLKKTFSAVKISNQLLLKMNINPLKAPGNEASIMKHWKYTDKVYVSCVCITFNQEGYIRDAINGMLAQVTDYRFEVIIHDDVSNDNTRKILLEYKNKYPNIIKLVLQTENQYQQGKKITPLAIAHADGEYIALCEGDDYWIDEYKLQKQIKELISNPNVNLVITQALSLYPDETTKKFCNLGSTKRYISFADCILGPKKDFYPTATFFFKRSIILSLPDWFYTIAPVGDYYIQLFASYNNGCIYLPDVTSTYRRDSIGSWSQSLNFNKFISDRKNRINCNKLISEELQLNKLEKLALNRSLFIYKKDITLSYLRHKKYFIFILNIIINFFSSPIDYSKIMFISLVRKIGTYIQSGD
ncbi:glycosyltransferase [Providencia hangzhouensis]|uniref:glycosyltransferase n=1 Tax=Providencia TaxID=586 RepID=UPI001CE1E903|nr:glycosyltransferase [Providencia alcalifaciens]ELR5053642.1 glycosyltransferase [Providencia rettgeri]ELR5181339.1 glycosyltransferase [Providencia rettgeri]ELR5275323.1 glycosyltransferase [Providencia rettgeri]UBX47752.1 glycosyltransferase [Providencia alcalifaciens]